MSVLKKDHLDEVLKSFPQIEKAFRIKAQERLSELEKLSNAQSAEAVTNRTNISEFGRALQQNDELGDSFFYKAEGQSEFEEKKNSDILHERQT